MSEAAEQQKVIEWCRTTAYRLHGTTSAGSGLIFHIPNGGWRTRTEAARLKALGVKAGVSDLFLPVAVAPHHGLWIELKAGNGQLQANQADWLAEMQQQGYMAVCAHGADEAIATIRDYLGLPA